MLFSCFAYAYDKILLLNLLFAVNTIILAFNISRTYYRDEVAQKNLWPAIPFVPNNNVADQGISLLPQNLER